MTEGIQVIINTKRRNDDDMGPYLAKSKYSQVLLVYNFWADTSTDRPSYEGRKSYKRHSGRLK